MKTEIERARESIKEYRKGYGQPQLPTDCIIQLMMGHAKSEQLILSGVVKSDSEQLVCDDNELDCPYEFTSRCTMGRCGCKPKAN